MIKATPWILFAVLILCGCGSRLFYANFDADPPDGPPSASPPGPPDGDRIAIPGLGYERAGEPPLMATVIEPGFSGRTAVYTEAQTESRSTTIPSIPSWVAFHGIAPTSTSEQYWFAWNGYYHADRDESDTQHPLLIKFIIGTGSGTENIIAAIKLEAFYESEVLLQTSIDPPQFEAFGQIGPAAGIAEGPAIHTIVLHFDRAARQYSLTIFPSGVITPRGPLTSGWRPALLPATADLESAPGLLLFFENAALEEPPVKYLGRYYIDDVIITEVCPHEVPSGSGKVTRYNCS
jgi:hypothetical protein